MKVLKGLLIVIFGIVVLILVVALFVKKSYTVERRIAIEQPEGEVFNYIKYLKNQNNFSKWATMDPAMKQEFEGTDGTPGFVSSWESDKKDVGKGEQKIIKVTDNDRVDYDLHFIKPFEARAQAYMTTDSMTDNSTLVSWGFTSKMNYPMNIMLLFTNMDAMVGNDLSVGLENLKKILEN